VVTRGPIGSRPVRVPLVEVRGRGSRPVSGPRPVGSLLVGQGFRILPLTSRYALFLFDLVVEFLECD
jgi:hypothetical protein